MADHLRQAYTARETLAGQDDAVADGDDCPGSVLNTMEIEAGLSGLPPLEREVLILFHLRDLSLGACAEVLGVPAGHGQEQAAPRPPHAAGRAGRKGIRGMSEQSDRARWEVSAGLERALAAEVSLRSRTRHVAVGLAGVCGVALVAVLWATEPGPLPARTRLPSPG
ncbi:hypothetical protein R6L23_11890 [Streptomyces sp. SR27]|uniref:RNA polymerase sigma factor n=1 Tax=Streptomyces sp. SR27 TaxID=3076630 RepID=UPI00295B9F1F|nr:hypothetical protein [Streptomyces sp. SR27]MDV9188906.1 hypothetical protein [Streptomyces sp. SR27]